MHVADGKGGVHFVTKAVGFTLYFGAGHDTKCHKKCSQGHPKVIENEAWHHQNYIHAKVVCVIISIRKPWFSSPKHPDFSKNSTMKSDLETNPKLKHEFPMNQ